MFHRHHTPTLPRLLALLLLLLPAFALLPPEPVVVQANTDEPTLLMSEITSEPYGWVVDEDNTLYFKIYKKNDANEIWRIDGTPEGTRLLKAGGGENILRKPGLTMVNGQLFFRAYDADYGIELWTSDGTAAGTVMVKDINPGDKDAIGYPPVIFSIHTLSPDNVFFAALIDPVYPAYLPFVRIDS